MTATAEKPKKHISVITAEYKPFWQPLFDHMGLSNPTFGAKLCYLAKEFTNDGTRVPCIRFFPNELSTGNEFYTELFDWNQNRYEPERRSLYRLKHDPNWQKNTDKFLEIPSEKLSTSTYAVRLSDFELVHSVEATATGPDLVKVNTASAPSLFSAAAPALDGFDEAPFTEAFAEMADDHYSKMTIRDLYCMLNNVPMSNKKWLNQLVEKGRQWQNQK